MTTSSDAISWLEEGRWILRKALPMSGTHMCYSFLIPATLAFCGNLGKLELDAAGLAISIYQLTVENCSTTIRWGIMGFLAQTLGGTKRHRVGVFVQRGLMAAVLLAFISWTLSLNAANLLILMGQDPEIVVLTEKYLMVMMPGSLGMILGECLVAYTDTLGRLWPTFVTRLTALAVNFLLHYLLVLRAGWGIMGSAVALSISLSILPLVQGGLIWRCGMYRDTWTGWSPRALADWGPLFRALAPCLATQTLWIFGTESGNFLAGLMGRSEIAAESVLFQVKFIAFLVPIGVGSALLARIGSFLGAGQPDRAVRTLHIGFVLMTVSGAAFALVIYLLRFEVPRLFGMDEESTALFTGLTPYLSAYCFLQFAAYPALSAMRASARHSSLLVMNAVAFYAVGLPLGISLAFAAGWRLEGLWVGFVSAAGVFFILPAAAVLCLTDWRRLATAASGRAEQETDMEALGIGGGERRPLLAADGDGEKPEKRGWDGGGGRAAGGAAGWAAALRPRLPLLAGVLLVFLASLVTRLSVPPPLPLPTPRPGNATTDGFCC